MEENSTKTDANGTMLFAGEAWFDPIEAGIRGRVRGFIQELLEQELTAALGRTRHERTAGEPVGYRNGTRERQLLGSFGPVELSVPRARMATERGATQEWRSATLPRYARMTKQVEALIAGACLSGTNTRRVKRALAALFGGAVGKDVVSRTWRKVRTDWDAWNTRDLTSEDLVRLILDGTVVRVRLDRKATNISLLVVLGVRRDGQKLVLAVKNMGGESEAAWHGVLDDLIARGLRTPEFLITDGGAGLERALAALWPDVPAQRCTVHKHRNLLAHAPDALHEEVSADYTGMIYAALCSSRHPCLVRDEAFVAYPPGQWSFRRRLNGRAADHGRATEQAVRARGLGEPFGSASWQPDASGCDHAAIRSRHAVSGHRPGPAAGAGCVVPSRRMLSADLRRVARRPATIGDARACGARHGLEEHCGRR